MHARFSSPKNTPQTGPIFRTKPQKTEAPIIDRMVRSLSQVSPIELSQEQKAAILAGQEQVQEKQAIDYLSRALPRLRQQPTAQSIEPSVSDVIESFLESRSPGQTRDRFYKVYLPKSIPRLGLRPKPSDIVAFENNLECSPGGKAAYHRALRAFYNWLYSPASGYRFHQDDNPIRWTKTPKVPGKIMPAQSEKSVKNPAFSCGQRQGSGHDLPLYRFRSEAFRNGEYL